MLVVFFYSCSLVAASFHVLRLESLEGGDVDVSDEGIQLVGRVLVLVPQTGQANTHAERDVSEMNTRVNHVETRAGRSLVEQPFSVQFLRRG